MTRLAEDLMASEAFRTDGSDVNLLYEWSDLTEVICASTPGNRGFL